MDTKSSRWHDAVVIASSLVLSSQAVFSNDTPLVLIGDRTIQNGVVLTVGMRSLKESGEQKIVCRIDNDSEEEFLWESNMPGYDFRVKLLDENGDEVFPEKEWYTTYIKRAEAGRFSTRKVQSNEGFEFAFYLSDAYGVRANLGKILIVSWDPGFYHLSHRARGITASAKVAEDGRGLVAMEGAQRRGPLENSILNSGENRGVVARESLQRKKAINWSVVIAVCAVIIGLIFVLRKKVGSDPTPEK